MIVIKHRTEIYSRTESGKSWRATPDEVKSVCLRGKLAVDHWDRFVDAAPFFRRLGGSETLYRSYTTIGYRVTRVVSISSDRTIRQVHTFTVMPTTARRSFTQPR